MTSILTTGRVIKLPTSGGGSDRSRANQPLGAGLVQIASSNSAQLAREGSLRQLAEHPGWPTVFGSQGALGTAGTPDTFPWDADYTTDGIVVFTTGPVQIRLYGEQNWVPRIEARWTWKAPSTFGAGALMVVLPGLVQPAYDTYPHTTTTTTSTALVAGSMTVLLGSLAATASRWLAPQPGATTPPAAPDEEGAVRVVSVVLGFYCTSNDVNHPAVVEGLSVFLREGVPTP